MFVYFISLHDIKFTLNVVVQIFAVFYYVFEVLNDEFCVIRDVTCGFWKHFYNIYH